MVEDVGQGVTHCRLVVTPSSVSVAEAILGLAGLQLRRESSPPKPTATHSPLQGPQRVAKSPPPRQVGSCTTLPPSTYHCLPAKGHGLQLHLYSLQAGSDLCPCLSAAAQPTIDAGGQEIQDRDHHRRRGQPTFTPRSKDRGERVHMCVKVTREGE